MLCFATWLALSANSQTLTERLIVEDTPDSLFQKAYNVAFNKEGEYCFIVEKGDQSYAFTSHDTIGPFNKMNKEYSLSPGSLFYSKDRDSDPEMPFYYKHKYGTEVYGPIAGSISQFDGNKHGDFCLITFLQDTLHFYINGQETFKCSRQKLTIGGYNGFLFSSNGQHYICYNYINTIPGDTTSKIKNPCKLYVDGTVIDSSSSFNNIYINDNEHFIYSKYQPDKSISKYMISIHKSDTSFSEYFESTKLFNALESGAYYFSGRDLDKYYILINDHLYRALSHVDDILLLDKDNYFFTYKKDKKTWINVNSKSYLLDFVKILMPTMDSSGNFALYGLKNYYLYKYVNGEKTSEPLSKYGVRAKPLYISPTGESLHYYETHDSTYLYRDDELIFPPISNDSFTVHKYYDFLVINGDYTKGHSLFYFKYGEKAYWVYDGVISRPITPYPEKTHNWYKRNRGDFTDKGFYTIQQTDEKQYQVIINNKTYVTIEGIDKIVGENRFFDGTSLTFYVIKNNAYYQYVIK